MQHIKRTKQNQNNADLLLSVYELTARSSFQLGQKPRHQSHGRQFQHLDQEQFISPKKPPETALSPSGSIQKPPPSMLLASRRNKKQQQLIIRQQQTSQQHGMFSPRYQNLLATTSNTTTNGVSQSQQLVIQQLEQNLQKMEKKAESRKVCIKKLYQLLEKNERELDLYRTGKKGVTSNKTAYFQDRFQSFASKKSELSDILNTVYTRKNQMEVSSEIMQDNEMLNNLVQEQQEKINNLETIIEQLQSNNQQYVMEKEGFRCLIQEELYQLEQKRSVFHQEDDLITTFTTLISSFKARQHELPTLKDRDLQFENEIIEKNRFITNLKQDLEGQLKQETKLKGQLNNLESELNSVMHNLNECLEQCANLQFQLEASQEISEGMKEQVNELRIKLHKQEQHYQMEQNIAYQDLDTLRKELNEARNLLQCSQDFSSSLEGLLQEILSGSKIYQIDGKQNMISESIRQKLQEYRSQVMSHQVRMSESHSDLERLRSELVIKSDQLVNCSNEKEVMDRELRKSNLMINENGIRIANLEKLLADGNIRYSELCSEKQILSTDLNRLEQEKKQLSCQIATISSSLDEKENQINRLKLSQQQTLQNYNHTLLVLSEKEKDIHQSQRVHDELSNKIENLEYQIIILTSTQSKISTECSDYKQIIHELTKMLEQDSHKIEDKSEPKDSIVQKYRAYISSQNKYSNQMEEKIKYYEQAMQELRSRSVIAEQEYKSKLESHQDLLEGMNQQFYEQSETLSNLDLEKTELKMQIDRLEEAERNLKSIHQQAMNNYHQSLITLAEKEKDLLHSHRSIEEQKTRIGKLEYQLDVQISQQKEISRINSINEEMLVELKRKIDQEAPEICSTDLCSRYSALINKQKKQIRDTSVKLENAEKRVEDYSQQLQLTEQQMLSKESYLNQQLIQIKEEWENSKTILNRQVEEIRQLEEQRQLQDQEYEQLVQISQAKEETLKEQAEALINELTKTQLHLTDKERNFLDLEGQLKVFQSNYEGVIEKLQYELLSYKSSIEVLQNEKVDTLRRNMLLGQEIQLLEDQLVHYQTSLLELTQKLQASESQLEDVLLTNSQLSLEINKKQREAQTSQEDLIKTRQEITMLEDETKRLKEEHSPCRSQMDSLQFQLREKDQVLSNQDDQLQLLEVKLEGALEEIQSQTQIVLSASKKISELETHNLKMKAVMMDFEEILIAELTDMRLSQDNLNIGEMFQKFIREVKSKMQQSEEDIRSIRNKLEQATQELTETQKEVLQLNSQLAIGKQEMSGLQAQFEDFRCKQETTSAEHRELDAVVSQLKNQNTSLTLKNQKLEQQIQDISDQIKEKQTNFEELLDELNRTNQVSQQVTGFSHALETLLQELLYNRVNLTSVKLNEQQRDKLNEYRKKVGEVQTKLISADKLQKALDECKFHLTQYQQIVDKSEMRAHQFEIECQRLESECQRLNTLLRNTPVQQQPQQPVEEESMECVVDVFLDFSLRDEVLYGNKSFFDNISQIYPLQEEPILTYGELKNRVLMAEEEIQELQRQLTAARM